MTALNEYQRLEATGLWRETEDSQRREVVVSLGDATLVITAMNEAVLSHWSLPAVTRLNPGKSPALYAPDAHADEQLEIADNDMVEAIERIRQAIERRRPHPGRLRFWLSAAAIVGFGALALFWLPGAMTRQTASLLPAAARADIGERVLTDMAALAGRPCNGREGQVALRSLSRALFGEGAPRLVVLPSTVQSTTHLPGNIIVLNRSLVEDHEGPEVLAGYLLVEDLRRAESDPVEDLLYEAGIGATMRMLTSAALDDSHLQARAETLLTAPLTPVETPALLERFEQAGVSSEPFAYALDLSGETVLDLIEGDPMRGRLRAPLMSDQSWIALQEICGG